jgi:hypothetical protein
MALVGADRLPSKRKAAPPMLECGMSWRRGKEAVEQHPIIRTTRRTVLAGIAAALAPRPLVAQTQQRDGPAATQPFSAAWRSVSKPSGSLRNPDDEPVNSLDDVFEASYRAVMNYPG